MSKSCHSTVGAHNVLSAKKYKYGDAGLPVHGTVDESVIQESFNL
jgi:hypothetical protein